MALGAALCWAFAVILFQKGGETLPPLALNLFKNIVAIALLTPTLPLIGDPLLPDLPLSTWLILGASGLMGIAISDSLFLTSLKHLGAGLIAVVNTTYAPVLLVLSYLLLGERMEPLDYVGAALIAAGLFVGGASRPPPGRSRRDIAIGTAIGLAAMLTMGLGVIIMKPVLHDLPIIWATWWRVVVGGVGALLILLGHPERRSLLASLRPSRGWLYAAPAAAMGTYLAMMLWVGGMKYTLVSRAAPLNQMSTIFIFLLATVFLKEPLTLRRGAAVVLAAAGAILVTL